MLPILDDMWNMSKRSISGSYRLRRIARRAGVRRGSSQPLVPLASHPFGLKMELTSRCNLVCSYCYTNSPALTPLGPPELDAATWHAIAQEAIDLGVVEVVLTGGEPLLRRGLFLDLARLFAANGVAVTAVTNGWFLDDALALELAAIPGLQVNVSIDSSVPAAHDDVRGAGSWERAITAVDRLITHNIRHRVLRVVTPENQHDLAAFLNLMTLLGSDSVRLGEVIANGAAASRTNWAVDRKAARTVVQQFRDRHPDALVDYSTADANGLATIERTRPHSLLIRPNGEVRVDSQQPFVFGQLPHDTIADCWERLTGDWPPAPVAEWAAQLRSSADLATVLPVANRDAAVSVVTGQPVELRLRRPDAVRAARADVSSRSIDPTQFVTGLALTRPAHAVAYRTATSGSGQVIVRSLSPYLVAELNPLAAEILAAVAIGHVNELVALWTHRFAGTMPQAITNDIVNGLHDLRRLGLVTHTDSRAAADSPEAIGLAIHHRA